MYDHHDALFSTLEDMHRDALFESHLGAVLLPGRSVTAASVARPQCNRCRAHGCSICNYTGRKIASKRTFKKRAWTKEEDDLLIKLVRKADMSVHSRWGRSVHFPSIAKHVEGRSVQSVRERYRNHLKSRVRGGVRGAKRSANSP